MANNRMYLKCRECGEDFFLGKRFDSLYYWSNYGKMNNERNKHLPNWKMEDDSPLEDRLNSFFKKHACCGIDCFELIYENDPDGPDADLMNENERLKEENKVLRISIEALRPLFVIQHTGYLQVYKAYKDKMKEVESCHRENY